MELAKKIIAEIVGTFIFLGTIIVVVNVLKNDGINFLKIGLALSIAIVIFGSISGGHFNPAVSFMFYINKQLSTTELIAYILSQLIGATLVLAMFKLLYSSN
jgi:glycerol uptake facilitator-like aquaporin